MTQSSYEQMMAECLPLIKLLGAGRYAITVGGSRGKGTEDQRSDFDFRLYCDEIIGGPCYWQTPAWAPFAQAVGKWRRQGVEIDYVWVRTIEEIDTALLSWLEGQIRPVETVWTLWGYHLLPDLYHQQILDDPYGVAASWKEQLRVFPPKLKEAILRKHLESLRYWKEDCHYARKVERGDVIFLAGVISRLAHDILQVLFALNETYYVGDGSNLQIAQEFCLLPPRFTERVTAVLCPTPSAEIFAQQRQAVLDLVADVEALVMRTEAWARIPFRLPWADTVS